jgi:hypothetical protein
VGILSAAKHRATQPQGATRSTRPACLVTRRRCIPCNRSLTSNRSLGMQRLVALVRCHTDARSNCPTLKLQDRASPRHGGIPCAGMKVSNNGDGVRRYIRRRADRLRSIRQTSSSRAARSRLSARLLRLERTSGIAALRAGYAQLGGRNSHGCRVGPRLQRTRPHHHRRHGNLSALPPRVGGRRRHALPMAGLCKVARCNWSRTRLSMVRCGVRERRKSAPRADEREGRAASRTLWCFMAVEHGEEG